jgi:hypothetical protein
MTGRDCGCARASVTHAMHVASFVEAESTTLMDSTPRNVHA